MKADELLPVGSIYQGWWEHKNVGGLKCAADLGMICTVFHAHPTEEHAWTISGTPGECHRLWNFVLGGGLEGNSNRELVVGRRGLTRGPGEFVVRLWKRIDIVYNYYQRWEVLLDRPFDVRFLGVRWLEMRHNSETSFCSGRATFHCEELELA